MNSVKTASDTEQCPNCGRPIEFYHTEVMGKVFEGRIECVCVTERKEKERAEHIQKGRKIIRHAKRKCAGLSTRAMNQRFENFTPDNGQQEAYNACVTFAEQYAAGKNDGTGLLLIGGVGCGKTHLATAVINKAIDLLEIPDNDAEHAATGLDSGYGYSGIDFIGTIALLDQLRSAYDGKKNPDQIMGIYQKAKLLVLDDLGAEKPTEWALDRLFSLIDYRYNECLPTIITTNADIKELGNRPGGRICDRIRSMCATYAISTKSHRITARLQASADKQKSARLSSSALP